LTLLSQIESNGLMHMTGFFPSVPSQIKFELLYAPVEGQRKLFGVSVALGQSGPDRAATASPGRRPGASAHFGRAGEKPAKPKE